MRLLYEQLGDIPVGFTEVEYLENTGSTSTTVQYIDTGVEFVGDNHKVSIGFFKDDISTASQTAVCGVQGGTSNNELFAIYYGNLYVYGGNGDTTGRIRNGVWLGNVRNNIDVVLNNDTVSYVLNGDSAVSYTARTNYVDIDKTMYLFMNNNSTFQCLTGKIYYCKIWDKNVLIRDFVPCLDNNNVPCMYDKVGKKAYYNAGAGSFTYGHKIIPIEYLQFNGNQYIQTNFNTTNATSFKYEVKFDLSSNVTNAEARVFSNEGTGSGKYFDIYYVTSSDKLICRPPASGISFTPEKAAVFKYSTTVGKIQGYYGDDPNTLIYDSNATFTAPTVNINYKIGSRGNNAASQYLWQGKIYYVYFERENLVCDFIPVKDENGVGYLFDKSAHVLYANAGSGSFTCGPEKPNKKVRFLVDGYNRLPKGYTEVEYLESTGTQYIDTGVVYKNEYNIESYFTCNTSTASSKFLFGVYGTSLDRQCCFSTYSLWNTASAKANFYKGNLSQVVDNNDVNKVEVKNKTWYYNDTVNGNSWNFDSSDNLTMYLFAGHTTSGANYYFIGKMRSFKMWDNNKIIIRDFIPCLDANNTPCMYDRITKTAFYNQGTGNFSVGSKIIPIEYIENTGTQYLDTGYDMANIRQIDMAVNWSAHTDTRREIMGSATSGGYSFEVSATGYYGLGASNYSNVLAQKTDLLSWRYVVTKRPQLYRNGQLICTDTLIRVPVGTFKTAIADSWATHSKIYWFKIYTNNGVMVRDYIAVRDENNVGYMLDMVTHRLYGNVLTGTFVLGPDLKINTLRLVQDAVPTAYKRLNYIESSGAQYIDTGVIGVDGVLADINVMKTTATTNECFLGTWDSGSNRCWLAYAFSNKWYPGYDGSASDMVSVNQNAWTNIKSYIETSGVNKYFGYNINGTKYTLTNKYATFSGTNSIMMFAMNTNTGANYKATGRIGTCKITKDGVLVRDFVPVLRKSDNKAGMYDLITKQFYGNLGTGDFTYG